MWMLSAPQGRIFTSWQIRKENRDLSFHGAEYDITTGKLLKDVSQEVKEIAGSGASDLGTYRTLIMENSIYIRD